MFRLTPIALLTVSACASANVGKPTSSKEPVVNTSDNAADGENDLLDCHPITGPMIVALKPNIELAGLAVWAMMFSCKNIVYPADLASARVTVLAPNRLSGAEAWNLFVVSVESMGLAVDEKLGVVTITGKVRPVVPSDDLPTQAAFAGIMKLDETSYVLERSVVDKVFDDPASMGGGLRFVPSLKNGVANGFKVFAVRPRSLWAAIGFRNGDTIHSINGHDVSSPDNALEAYSKTREAGNLAVSITRLGKPLTLRYSIK